MYSRRYYGSGRVQQFFTRGHIPVTTALVVAAAAYFVLNFFTRGFLAPWMACQLPLVRTGPGPAPVWTLLTYPVAQGGWGLWPTINAFILCYWLWWVGGSLERSWDSMPFARFFVALTLVTSLVLWGGTRLTGVAYPLSGLYLPVVGLTAAWAAINPYEEILFWMVLKMRAWILAAIIVALMIFVEFQYAPLLGLFALANPLLGYLWVRGRIPGFLRGAFRGPADRPGPDLRILPSERRRKMGGPLDDLRSQPRRGPINALKDWQERRRLEKLWRNSGISDKDEHKGPR